FFRRGCAADTDRFWRTDTVFADRRHLAKVFAGPVRTEIPEAERQFVVLFRRPRPARTRARLFDAERRRSGQCRGNRNRGQPRHRTAAALWRRKRDPVLDACRNEGARDGEGIGADAQPGIVAISSCSPSERSYEIDELRHGAFTYSLLEGLRLEGENNCATV